MSTPSLDCTGTLQRLDALKRVLPLARCQMPLRRYDTLVENVVDPSHIPFAHHNATFLNKADKPAARNAHCHAQPARA